ncbi:hypothetical protein BGZ96_003728 [Linnemannia gamsii]|uniref:Uncharacterized protein n=1 Tax=Linnemannia gamsii TaxID=64522 RepID=A0ABQ7K7A2_9FUNG|nr:hypothetical protein BGZ96_003728 [Linnemannia gamsii]
MDERTSLVRSDNALNRANSPSHINNNGYDTGNGSQHNRHNNNNNQAPPWREDVARRDPWTSLKQVQRSLAVFQTWAAKILRENEESPIVNWVQNARVARTFMMIMNVIIGIFAFLLMGIEMVEMALREPILDYLFPESEMTLMVAGLTIIMEGELNNVWTGAFRHRKALISDFERRHQCCGYEQVNQRAIPKNCSEDPKYGFKVPCKAELTKDYERWQNRIQHLLLAQVTMLLPLLLLVMILSAIGFAKLKVRKQERLEDTEAQAEATVSSPAVDGRGTAHYERPLLEDVTAHIGASPFLIDVEAEPVRRTHDRPLMEPSLI